MSHRIARLTFHGRRLLVARVESGMPIAHVAKATGVSRHCAHRWVARFAAEGEDGLHDRSSRPHRCPTRTAPSVEQAVLRLRRGERRGQDWLGPELGAPARTVSRILCRRLWARVALRLWARGHMQDWLILLAVRVLWVRTRTAARRLAKPQNRRTVDKARLFVLDPQATPPRCGSVAQEKPA